VADDRDGAAPDPAALRAGYEQLRERVLAGRADGWRLGHAVLARRGMAGWIAAQAALPPAPADAPADDPPAGAVGPQPGRLAQPPAAAAAAERAEIVAVLSEMALAHAA